MSPQNFIKLSNVVLNTRFISRITIHSNTMKPRDTDVLPTPNYNNNKYIIYYYPISLFPNEKFMEVREDDNLVDYKIITNWMRFG